MADEWLKVTFYGKADPTEVVGMDPLDFWTKVQSGELFSAVDRLTVERTTTLPMLYEPTVVFPIETIVTEVG